jgi:hypothetical protein
MQQRQNAAALGRQTALAAHPPPGARAFANLLIQRATLEGSIVFDHFGPAPEAIGEIAGLIAEGRLTLLETVVKASSSCRGRSTCRSTARTSASSSSRRPAKARPPTRLDADTQPVLADQARRRLLEWGGYPASAGFVPA